MAGSQLSGRNARELCHEVSESLSKGRWKEASDSLVKLSEYNGSTKLGSLQRWVRDADGARFEDLEASHVLLWLLCRLAAGEVTIVVPPRTEILMIEPAWSPSAARVSTISFSPPNELSVDMKHIVASTFVVKKEKAAERQPPNHYDLRIWASRCPMQLLLPRDSTEIKSHDVPFIPGGKLIVSALSESECSRLLAAAKTLGFQKDEPLSASERLELELESARSAGGFACLGSDDDDSVVGDSRKESTQVKASAGWSKPSVAVVWVVDEDTNKALFERLAPFLPKTLDDCGDAKGRHLDIGFLAGLNARWRFYKYEAHGTYRPHVDGAWPGSAIVDKKYVYDAYGDRHSRLTCLVYLNDNFDGGATAFYSATENPPRLNIQGVRPQQGNVLLFPHGAVSGSLVHEGSEVTAGSKYVIRTEVLYRFRKEDRAPSFSGNRVRPDPAFNTDHTTPKDERITSKDAEDGTSRLQLPLSIPPVFSSSAVSNHQGTFSSHKKRRRRKR